MQAQAFKRGAFDPVDHHHVGQMNFSVVGSNDAGTDFHHRRGAHFLQVTDMAFDRIQCRTGALEVIDPDAEMFLQRPGGVGERRG